MKILLVELTLTGKAWLQGYMVSIIQVQAHTQESSTTLVVLATVRKQMCLLPRPYV